MGRMLSKKRNIPILIFFMGNTGRLVAAKCNLNFACFFLFSVHAEFVSMVPYRGSGAETKMGMSNSCPLCSMPQPSGLCVQEAEDLVYSICQHLRL